jgi:hypothetical protein
MALLAFVFTVAAVSPATLLLIGRPLKGLDQRSPAGTMPDEAPPKGEDAAHKADTGGEAAGRQEFRGVKSRPLMPLLAPQI